MHRGKFHHPTPRDTAVNLGSFGLSLLTIKGPASNSILRSKLFAQTMVIRMMRCSKREGTITTLNNRLQQSQKTLPETSAPDMRRAKYVRLSKPGSSKREAGYYLANLENPGRSQC